MNCSMPGFLVLHCLPEFAQTLVHWVGDTILQFRPLLLPSPPVLNLSQHQGLFPTSQLFASDGQSIGPSASASVLPMNIQGWFPLGLTGLISLLSRGLSRVFSSTTVWNCQFFGTQPSVWSNSHMTTGNSIALTIWAFVSRVISLLFSTLSRFVITFLPRSLLISWRQPLQMLVHWIPIAFLVIYFLIQGNYNSLCSEGFPKESNHIRLDVICI